ncbi:MAG: GldG family protein [Thermoanaerobaculia bacterium]
METRTKKTLVASSTLSAGVLLAAALLALVNYFGWKYHKRLDWTHTRLYSLSEKSQQVLGELKNDLTVTVFQSPGSPLSEPVEGLLAQMSARSSHVKVHAVDAAKNPVEVERLLKQYQTSYDPRAIKIVLDNGKDRRIIEENQLADIDSSEVPMGGMPHLSSFKGEQVLTGALYELSSGTRAKILFTTGHGEKSLDDFAATGFSHLKELIGGQNLELSSWGSLGQKAVPAETSLVVVAGPISPFAQPELDVFRDYLKGGGRMLWLLDPPIAPDGKITDLGLGPWLAGYGVKLGANVVVDPDKGLPFFGAETFFVDSYGSHKITQVLADLKLNILLSLARSVGADAGSSGYQLTELLKSSDAGWGETNLTVQSGVKKDPEDLAGPVAVGVVAEPKESEGQEGSPASKMRLVVLGDSDFLSDRLVGNASNGIFAENLFNWLLARDTLLGIPPKKMEQPRLNLTQQQLLTAYLWVGLLPLAAIAGGIWVYLKRRR